MKIFGIKVDGKAFFEPSQIAMEAAYIESLKECTPLCREVKVHRNPKTQKQLGSWWGLFAATIISQFDDNGWDSSYLLRLDKPTGIPCTKELLKEYMYSVCAIYRDGKRITMRDMDTAEIAKFFDNCRNFAASQWSVCVPEPQKNWRENQ